MLAKTFDDHLLLKMEASMVSSAIRSMNMQGENLSPNSSSKLKNGSVSFSSSTAGNLEPKIVKGKDGYVLEDVPHFSDYISNLPVSRSFSSKYLLENVTFR